MASPAKIGANFWGESYDCRAGQTYPQYPTIEGPFWTNGTAGVLGALRICVHFNPWGGVQPAPFVGNSTPADWFRIYPYAEAPIDWTQTGGFSVYAQNKDEVGIPTSNGFDLWLHEGNEVPDGSDGQSTISAGHVTFSVYNHHKYFSHWRFNPDPPPPGIGRDGYYAGSHKLGNGLSGNMPGVYIQNSGDLAVLLLAHLNLDNAGNIQTTQHGGPQDVGWSYHGINRPHRFFASEPRQWGVVMSAWSKSFTNFIGYTGDIPWRTNLRDTDYQMQSIIMIFRGRPTGIMGGMFG